MSIHIAFSVRDLHAMAPDDYPGPLFDVRADLPDGRWAYSDECYLTRDEAEVYMAGIEFKCESEGHLRLAAFSFVED